MAGYYAESKIGYPQYADTIGRVVKYDDNFKILTVRSYRFTNTIPIMKGTFALGNLPNELLLIVMELSDVVTLAQLRLVNRRYCELMANYSEFWRSAIVNTTGTDSIEHSSEQVQKLGLLIALRERNWKMGYCIMRKLTNGPASVTSGIATQGDMIVLYTEDGVISHLDLADLQMTTIGVYMKGIRAAHCRSDGAVIAASLNGDILLYSSVGFLGLLRPTSPCTKAVITSSYLYGLCDDGNIVQFDIATQNQVASYIIPRSRVYYDITAFGDDAVVSTSDMLLLVKGSEQMAVPMPYAPGRVCCPTRLLEVYHKGKLITYRKGGFSVYYDNFREEIEIFNVDLWGGPLCVIDMFLILASFGSLFIYNINDYRMITQYEFLPADAYITGLAGSGSRIVASFRRSESQRYKLFEEELKVIDLDVLLSTDSAWA